MAARYYRFADGLPYDNKLYKPAHMRRTCAVDFDARAEARLRPTIGRGSLLCGGTQCGVPRTLLIAIAGAESGYHPWALNIRGHQVFCQSRAEAENVLASTPTDNVDIGLMQINWRFWGPRSGLASREALLDPRRNLEFGAAILKDGLTRGGSLWRRISNYHSGDAAERERYSRMVYEAYLHYMHGKRGRGMIH